MVEKDRYGDKLRDKEKAEEDRYFAEREKAALAKLRAAQEAENESAIRDLAKGRCPKCGTRLETRMQSSVEIDECGSCHGVWLDAGELEALSKRGGGGGWLEGFLKSRL